MNKKLLAVIFGAGLMLAACGGGDDEAKDTGTTDTGTTDSTETASVDAEKIVNSKCISCHGGNLEGQGNFPALADVGSRLSEDEILDVILNGRGAMPGKIIEGADAEAVAAWLAEKK
ncbi:cytochrome c551 [Psychrobacillus sp. FSL K6-4046]|uniref:cytochrome c551 n=1 Tax=Psychrobacillus sp. FSL K6-4046 TaxID=2921550 RepID=UPI00315B387A